MAAAVFPAQCHQHREPFIECKNSLRSGKPSDLLQRSLRSPSSKSVIVHGLKVGVTAYDFVAATQQYQIGRVLRASDTIVDGAVTIQAAFTDADAACRAVAAWDGAIVNGSMLSVQFTPAFVLDEKESILIPHNFTAPLSSQLRHVITPTPTRSTRYASRAPSSISSSNSGMQAVYVSSLSSIPKNGQRRPADIHKIARFSTPLYVSHSFNTQKQENQSLLSFKIKQENVARDSIYTSTAAATTAAVDVSNQESSAGTATSTATTPPSPGVVKKLIKKAERKRLRGDSGEEINPTTLANVRTYAVDPLKGKRKWDELLSPEALRAREERDARYQEVVALGFSSGRTKRQWARARKPGKRERQQVQFMLGRQGQGQGQVV